MAAHLMFWISGNGLWVSDGRTIETVDKPATPPSPEWATLQARIDAAVARRKAKRETLIRKVTDLDWSDARDMIQVTLDKAVVDMWYGTAGATDGDELARAMSTPLPHDPDIHTRLMPWRGK